jgi:hypothetical protein
MSQPTPVVYYIITDSGDGSAALRLFKTQEARDLYLECNEDGDWNHDLSEGGSYITQDEIDNAMTVDKVNAVFNIDD